MNIKLIDGQLKYNRNEKIRRRWWFLKSAYSSGNISDYCRSRRIKRSYYHFWFRRLKESRWDIVSLSERSRRPLCSPNQTSAKLVKKIKRERKREGRGAYAIHFMNGLLEKAPFAIECIQTDHGSEFTNRMFDSNCTVAEKTREHALDKLCRENGIRHKLIPVGQCEINGKVERSHRIDDEEFFFRNRWSSCRELEKKFNRWIRRYNERRLHGGIGWKTPAEFLKQKLTQSAIQTV